MDVIENVMNRKERPAYVKFVREAQEDHAASREKGIYVARDVDIACITPPYSKDVMKFEVNQWFSNMRLDVTNGRMPQEWEQQYHEKYDAWKKGEELPLDGVPIKGWAVASPAAQETLLRMNILTVEDLALINDEGIRRIGMGGVDLKTKAIAWLQAAKDRGPITQEIAAVKKENEQLKGELGTLRAQVETLMTQARVAPTRSPVAIEASDLLDTPNSVVPVSEREGLEAQYRVRHGRSPHPSTNIETLRARLAE